MVTASELRMNNLILRNGKITKVHFTTIMDLYNKEQGIKNEYLDNLKFAGIPLTSGFLDNCAQARKNDHIYFFTRTDMNGHENSFNIISIVGKFICMMGLGVKEIKWVHTLQNIYYIQADEELEFYEDL
jgi:hypothetical protein